LIASRALIAVVVAVAALILPPRPARGDMG
jgi:hypothetical protein